MKLDEILSKVPEGKFVVVGIAPTGNPEDRFFTEGPDGDKTTYYDFQGEARAFALARFNHPQNKDDEFFWSYRVYNHNGENIFGTG